MFSRRLLVVGLCAVLSSAAAAETVAVKYRGPVPLDTFECASIDRSNLVQRVCYDAAQLTIHLIAFTLFAQPAVADQGDKLVGLSEEQLLSCAGIPAGQMVSGNSTFFQYGEFNERGAFVPLGDTLFITKRQRGCHAIVTLKNGVVTKVMLKTKGLISGPMACQRIFSEC